GGPVVALLLVLSVFALTIILLKLWQFYFSSGASRKAVSGAVSLWIAQDYEKALAAVSRLRGPVARVVGFAMAGAASRREEQHLREETEHLAQSEISALRSYLRGLEAVVQVAPLLGLFGTVIGMIEAFQSLQAAGTQVNPADLAGGIWVALLTTAVGLAVAMPVSLVLYWFESHIERVRASMELFVTEVMTNPPVRAVKSQAAEGMRVRLAVAMAAKNAN
ncbi:MAG: MotA/TolQ/ExbB proton channel family protein, partial [Hyphomicrobiales bacterium]